MFNIIWLLLWFACGLVLWPILWFVGRKTDYTFKSLGFLVALFLGPIGWLVAACAMVVVLCKWIDEKRGIW